MSSAVANYTALFTWRAWVFGWAVRVASQAVLYGLFGRLLGSPGQQRYLFVGAAVLVAATEALMACAWTVNERRIGVLSLVVASPSDPFPVLLGRGVAWLPGGLVISAGCLFLIGPAFGVRLAAAQAVVVAALIVLTSLSTYCLAIALGTVVVAHPDLRNVVGTVAGAGFVAVCGVAVPLGEWPAVVRAIGTAVPLTHTLSAIRAAIDGAPAAAVVRPTALAVVWATVWLGVGRMVLSRLVASGRRSGAIELGGWS
ncbi:MAG TPA: ABC transporter permease [Acidimicrobiia bacterium]|nr:ABC transporter permease [Acidimicrobiia bacterium]